MQVVMDSGLFYDTGSFAQGLPFKLLGITCFESQLNPETTDNLLKRLLDQKGRLCYEDFLEGCNEHLMPHVRPEYVERAIRELLHEPGGRNRKLERVLAAAGKSGIVIYGTGFGNVLQQLPVLNGTAYTPVANSIEIVDGTPRIVLKIREADKHDMESHGVNPSQAIYVGTDQRFRGVAAHYVDFSGKEPERALREIVHPHGRIAPGFRLGHYRL